MSALPASRKTFIAVQKTFGAGNLAAARLIAADPMRYGGEDALAVRWGLERWVRHSAPRDEEAGPLFKQERA